MPTVDYEAAFNDLWQTANVSFDKETFLRPYLRLSESELPVNGPYWVRIPCVTDWVLAMFCETRVVGVLDHGWDYGVEWWDSNRFKLEIGPRAIHPKKTGIPKV